MTATAYDPFADLPELGEAHRQLLAAAGVSNIHALALCDAQQLTGILSSLNQMFQPGTEDPSVSTVERWIEAARAIDPMTVAQQQLQERLGKAGQVLTLEEWQDHLGHIEQPTAEEMKFIVDQALLVIEQVYVHLGMKRARRAINPAQSLRLLRRRIDDDMDHREFHDAMLSIMKSLGDIHTAYRLPPPFRHSVAFLPILLQRAFVPGDSNHERRDCYLVTQTLWEPSPHLPLKPGDEVVSWNGVPMDQAVREHARLVEGSNPSASRAFGLQFMTMRWLGAAFQPDSPWVIIGYVDEQGNQREIRLHWRIIMLDPNVDNQFMTRAQYLWFMFNPPAGDDMPHDGAVNPASQIAHVSTMAIFSPHKDATHEERKVNRQRRQEVRKVAESGGRRKAFQALSSPVGEDEASRAIPSHMAGVLEAEILEHEGTDYGYLRVRAFPFSQGDVRYGDFVTEFRRLLSLMPSHGLILDVRGNPGGSASNAEMLLQLLCAREIHPLTFQFLASPLTLEVTGNEANQALFGQWRESIELAMNTGSQFSKGLPISDPDNINFWGQEYFGPVVLVTSATSYSSADFISASFDDHEVGHIIGVDRTTGGGGANVWMYREHLLNYLPDTKSTEFRREEWPSDINLQFAVRRCLRINRNSGTPIEELGVPTKRRLRYRMTRSDFLDNKAELRRFAMDHLSRQPHYDLSVRRRDTDRGPALVVRAKHMDWIDLIVNGRLLSSHDLTPDSEGWSRPTEFSLGDGKGEALRIELHGYRDTESGGVRVARYKHHVG